MKASIKARTSPAHQLTSYCPRADSPRHQRCGYCRRSRTLSGLNRTIGSLRSSGRGPSFHLHLYPAKSVRSIGPCMGFICFRYGDATWNHRKGDLNVRGRRGPFIADASAASPLVGLRLAAAPCCGHLCSPVAVGK